MILTWQNPKGKKSREQEQEPAPLLTINGETLQAMNLDDACYLGYWGTGNGDTRATKEVVRQRITAACDLIKCHPLTPKLATELFTGKGMGVFLFLAALIEWSERRIERHETIVRPSLQKCDQEITLVCICRLRMRLYVTMTLNDIYISNNFYLISLRRLIFIRHIYVV